MIAKSPRVIKFLQFDFIAIIRYFNYHHYQDRPIIAKLIASMDVAHSLRHLDRQPDYRQYQDRQFI